MVIGNGMLAKRFISYKLNDNYVIFASGVSNSKNTDESAYQREFNLLKQTIDNNISKTLVYFSTCSIYDPGEDESRYVMHKKQIEEFILKNASDFLILRASNLAGNSDNQNTILNFFYYHMIKRINFDLWTNSSRNLIDIDDLFQITNYILQKKIFSNRIINIANPTSYHVIEIISTLEKMLKIRANYIPVAKGSQFSIDVSLILPLIRELNIKFGESYLDNLIKKYYLEK